MNVPLAATTSWIAPLIWPANVSVVAVEATTNGAEAVGELCTVPAPSDCQR